MMAKVREKEKQRLVADHEALIKEAKVKKVDAKKFLETLQKLESEHKTGFQKIATDIEDKI